MIRINELKLPVSHSRQELQREIAKTLRLKQEITEFEIIRQSIDARKKPQLFYVYTVELSVPKGKELVRKLKNRKVTWVEKKEYQFPFAKGEIDSGEDRPVIAGSGPAGLFCALMLARAGLRPILLERGECVEKRTRTVEQFWKTGRLKTESNVQFGEGGAGTFSDGKLNTQAKDPEGRIRFVLKTFVEAGAKEEILYQQRPHVGTDVLTGIVRTLREEILSLGGTVLFEHCLTDIELLPDRKKVLLTVIEKKETEEEKVLRMQTPCLVLATGHSARDTFRMLRKKGVRMEAKSFAVGLRMEHRQTWINQAMYGCENQEMLGAANYKVTHKCSNGRGVYSFCMCPGGYVVNASSQENRLAVNGMSYSDRAGENANSAIVVTVTPQDYGNPDDPLSGISFQEKLEENAFRCGNGMVPIQRFEDFKEGRTTTKAGCVRPQVKGDFCFSNVRDILPEEINRALMEGIEGFGKNIPGFDHPDALLLGVESRTSSPVRIKREETGESSIPGIFPCGEGAGYAGGITSAAADGVRVAEAVCKRMSI